MEVLRITAPDPCCDISNVGWCVPAEMIHHRYNYMQESQQTSLILKGARTPTVLHCLPPIHRSSILRPAQR